MVRGSLTGLLKQDLSYLPRGQTDAAKINIPEKQQAHHGSQKPE